MILTGLRRLCAARGLWAAISTEPSPFGPWRWVSVFSDDDDNETRGGTPTPMAGVSGSKGTLDAGPSSQTEAVFGFPIRWGCYGPHAARGLLLAIVPNSAIPPWIVE